MKWFLLLFHVVLYGYDLDETLGKLEEMISHREKGAYLCFDKADVQMALGKEGDFWGQVAMQEMLALNEQNVLKGRFLPYNALNGHRVEDQWASELFNRFKLSWNDSYAPLAPAFLSSTHIAKCIRFLQQLQNEAILLVGDVPETTRELLFGPKCKSIPQLEPLSFEKYTVVILALDSKEKFLAKRLLDEADSFFLIDLSALRAPLCEWSPEDWASWIGEKSRIKVLYTSALIPYKFEERKQEYIKCLQILENYGLKDQTYIVEAGGFTPLSFFENYCDHVFYANTNDTSFINKGVNEARSSMAAFDYYDFDDEDMIIKLTGRYFFNNDDFLKLVKAHPEIDAFASPFPNRGVTTGCFAIRCKYYKQMLQALDFKKMEEKLIDIEWEVGQFIEKMARDGAKVMYLEKMGITANVANVGIEQW